MKKKEKQVVNNAIKIRVLLVLTVLIIFLVSAYISYRGNYLETIEIGYNFKEVFTQNLKYQYAIMGISFVILFIAIYVTNSRIKKALKTFFEEEKKEIPKLPNKSIAFIISIIVSIVISSFIKESVALFLNKAWFAIDDPVFNVDIGFYIFQKPFIEMLIIYFIAIVIGLTVYSAIYYIIVFNVHFDGISAQTIKKSKILNQLTTNIMLVAFGFAVFILVKTQGIITDKFLILGDDASTGIFGAGVTDIFIKLWGYRILSIVVIISVYIAIKSFRNKNTKRTIIAILTVPVYLLILFVVMVGFKFIYINTNELDKEKQYIAYNIENTKTAYNIKIDEIELDSNNSDIEEIEKNSKLINNIALISEDITLRTIEVTQTNTGYYSYRNANISNYNIDGEEKLVYIAPREIVSGGNRTYNNKTYEYTHGFGAVITSASHTNQNGTVEYIQKDFTTKNQPIKISQPRIYFGLDTNNTIVTNGKNRAEFDYPTSTSQNAEYSYDGSAGLKLNFIDRLILAIKEKDINLAFSNSVTNDSKILINRNIIERAKTIMPYLIYDSDPYLVINDEGRLIWVLDAYTVTDKYPYSQPTTIEYNNTRQQINYIRNSVKILVDAYDGTIKFYITDKSDPIIMAYRNIYPTLFEDLNETIPQDISKHFVYPEYLYNIQAAMLERYHNVSTDVLYRSDDVWEKDKYSQTLSNASKGLEQTPYYTMVKTKDSDKMELGLVLPYTQLDKQSLRAYLVGKYNDDGCAELKLYKYATDSNMLGSMQLDTLLSQDETISKELDSINVAGTRIIKNMIIVPINDTVLYIEPIYQLPLNEAKSVPMLKKVIVASGNKVAISDTLEGAIKNLLSQSAVKIEVENTDTIEDLVQLIIKANANLEKSNINNDWEMIGKDMKKLQELIKKLEILEAEQKKQNSINNVVNTVNNTTINNIVH